MNLAYQCSNAFVGPFLVSLRSLLLNTNLEEINLFILSKDFSEENLEKTKKIIQHFDIKFEIKIIKIPQFDKLFNGFIFDDYNGKRSQDSFIKILLHLFLPVDVDRILYLDSDTLIVDDISKFYNSNLDEYCAAAIPDCLSEKYYNYFNLGNSDNYYNTGVILLNLNNCRKFRIENKIFDLLKENKGYLFFSEQSAFTIAYKEMIKPIDTRFNVTTVICQLSYKQLIRLRKPFKCPTKQNVKDAIENPAIIHFTSFVFVQNRVWYKNNKHLFSKLYKSYADNTVGFEYYEDNRKISKKIIDFALTICPKIISINLISFVYNNIRLNKYLKYKKGKLNE